MVHLAKDRWAKCREFSVPHIRIRQVARIIESRHPASVIDLGCHDGQLGRLLPGVSYVGCDFVPPDHADFNFVLSDLNDGGLPSTLPVADVVVASGVLEYVDNLPDLLRDIGNHVAPGGALVATYFNMNHVSRAIALAAGRSFAVHPDWRGFHSRRELRRMLGEAGFVVDSEFASTESLRPSPAVGDTESHHPTLRHSHVWSGWLAHQFIYVAHPVAAGTDR